MVCSHRCSAEEGTSVPLLPETAEEVWNEPQHPQIILHLHILLCLYSTLCVLSICMFFAHCLLYSLQICPVYM